MKRLIAVLLCIAIISLLAACNNPGDDKSSENQIDFDLNDILEKIGDNFSVTYRITYYNDEDGEDQSEITLTKTQQGYYYNLDDDGSLYIKEGNQYVMCSYDQDTGVFVKMPGAYLGEESVTALAASILGYMSMYSSYTHGLDKKDSATILGRNCDKYVFEYTAGGVKVNLEFFIDKETGLTMKFMGDQSGKSSNYNFVYECIALSLGNAELPEYTEYTE